MTAREFGIAIVGTGNIAAAHVHAVTSVPSAHLTGFASRSLESARPWAERHGVRAYRDVEEAVHDPDVDVVAICTPSGAHLEPAMVAVRAGKHVIVEKPIEVTVERAETLVREAERAGVVVATIFMSRYADANAFVREAVVSGRLGPMVQADAQVKWYRSQEYYDSGAWRGTVRLDGGGALMNQAIHQVDLLLWTMGPVREAFAYADTLTHERLEVEDTLVASLRFASGALGQITASTSLWPGRPKALHVHGRDGFASVEDDMLVDWRTRAGGDEERAEVLERYGGSGTGGASDPTAISYENHRRQYADVLAAIAEARPPAIDGWEGLRSLRLIEAIYRSVREGRPVASDEVGS